MIILERDNINLKENYYLYSFDPKSLNLKQHLEEMQFENSPSIELGSDGSIFILDTSRTKLTIYIPAANQVLEIEIPDLEVKNKLFANLFMDSSNRLWVDDLGWFDFSSHGTAPNWFSVVRSPVFIDVVKGAGVWSWSVPIFINENPNGKLWFDTSRGTGWLDTAQGKWCIFTSYSSNILEDHSGNLWLLANNSLYAQKP